MTTTRFTSWGWLSPPPRSGVKPGSWMCQAFSASWVRSPKAWMGEP
ncbi:MAG: hypothetical protein IJ048_05395 [Clostridia bacterium]|nr:hypothetical protein [Clostridia bacterium]